MRKYYILFLFLFRNGIADVYGQEVPVKHKIAKGETIEFIAQKYALTPTDLYELNPTLVNGFKENDSIVIAKVRKSSEEIKANIIHHIVQPNETKFGLSKKYNISISELERQNPQIINMLQKGHELKIEGKPSKNNSDFSKTANTDGLKTHVVVQGQTLWELARIYNVTVTAIIEENRAELGTYLQIGQELRIPVKNVQQQSKNAGLQQYTVVSGETKYGLAKRFGITITDLENLNPQIISMLRTGCQITIPSKNSAAIVNPPKPSKLEIISSETAVDPEMAYYTVLAGETKSRLSRKFRMTVPDLENLNPQIVDMLRGGQVLRIPKEKFDTQLPAETTVATPVLPANPLITDTETTKKSTLEASNESEKTANFVPYEVRPHETLYGLSKRSGLSQEKLIELNPELASGLKNGMLLNLPPENVAALKSTKENVVEVVQKDLSVTLKKGIEKEVTFLLPFSEDKFQTLLKSEIKNKSELSSSLAFYAGALIAMDSLKRENVIIRSKILNVDDLKGSVELDSLQNKLKNTQIVFAPTKLDGLKSVGTYLSKSSIPLILSDANTKTYITANTFMSQPSEQRLRRLVLDYITAKNENIIVVNAPSQKENRDFIMNNYPEAQFANVSKNSLLDAESLMKLLSSTKKNYIVLDSDKSGLILETTTLLLKESTNFSIQLVLIEPKDKNPVQRLSPMRFRILKMIYPALLKPNNERETTRFKKEFKVRYGFDPTNEALKGFDITYDALLRLFQEKTFELVAKETVTEQFLFKFKYTKNADQGYFNAGGFILQFDEESDTKILN